MVSERGWAIHHTTIYCWVQEYGSELDKRCRSYLQLTNDSWRVDESYIEVKRKWKYLYRAVDSEGNTLEFLLTAKRDAEAAKRFFRKTLKALHTQTPWVITVDKNPAYPKAIKELKAKKELPAIVELRQKKYLNKVVLQKLLEVRKAAWKRVFLCNYAKNLMHKLDSFSNGSFFYSFNLSFSHHVHNFVSLQRSPGVLNEPNPMPGLTNRFMPRWSCSTILFRYLICRNFTISGSFLAALSSLIAFG